MVTYLCLQEQPEGQTDVHWPQEVQYGPQKGKNAWQKVENGDEFRMLHILITTMTFQVFG